ncbi:sensor histidine kinase [Streptococcus zalophi]|uniref:histidine kinase n=1 Tax=Streptococcus zalophi TaxID=640031 RepID=A0A934P9A8_9STRE|nr:HAMP domain-containing sensor histidine kinase [Streptococcus zalophi]MBJ8349511.1 HAMP domain-containing histidine kinase [Streptococcus zalophi]MCR8967294.1 HAMP domain-containing histidine kinase [Streptococcus zalophi]
MLTKLKNHSKTDNFSYFIHFFAVFTGIFIVMTVIILQVMRFGIYSSIDASLQSAKENIDRYVYLSMTKTISGISQDYFINDNNRIERQMVANTDIIIYDNRGRIINDIDIFSNLHNIPLKTDDKGSIVPLKTTNIIGDEELYRSVTLEITSFDYPTVAYATVVINTTQLEEISQRYVKIIVTVMIIFWFISVGTSLYLAKWSSQPLRESYEKQKSFVENASHELRTPLSVLQNRLENLLRKPNATILESTENLASSLDEVRNMRILTTNLLHLARRDEGIKPDINDISPEFFDTLFYNYQIIAEENNRLFKGTNRLKQSFKSDEAILKQLITILFDNAIKYTEELGEIAVEVVSKDKQLIIRVFDNGIGIKDDDKLKIFDRFYRVDKARTRQKGGFGLGLSLAKQLANVLKAKIVVKDNIPRGSIFEIIMNK